MIPTKNAETQTEPFINLWSCHTLKTPRFYIGGNNETELVENPEKRDAATQTEFMIIADAAIVYKEGVARCINNPDDDRPKRKKRQPRDSSGKFISPVKRLFLTMTLIKQA